MKETPTLPLPPKLLEQLAATAQNPRYHAEGSVLHHTAYVLQQFEQLHHRFDLSEEEIQVLRWAAILHDLGKTTHTIWQDGRWRSPGHERAGLPFALDILLQKPEISNAMRRKILDLVRWHGLPLKYASGLHSETELQMLGTRTDLRLLSIFSIFDFEGRDCKDKQSTMERVYHFQEQMAPKVEFEFGRFRELDEAYQSWNLKHKNAAWNALKMKNPGFVHKLMEARQVMAPMNFGKKVSLVWGEPLSGKSTHLASFDSEKFVVLLSEHGFVEGEFVNEQHFMRKMTEFKHLLIVYLNRHKHVWIEARWMSEARRIKFAQMIRDLEVEMEYFILEAGRTSLEERNALSAEPMTENELLGHYLEMDLIHPWEAHKITYLPA